MITVKRNDDGTYTVVSGMNRFEIALSLFGWVQVTDALSGRVLKVKRSEGKLVEVE